MAIHTDNNSRTCEGCAAGTSQQEATHPAGGSLSPQILTLVQSAFEQAAHPIPKEGRPILVVEDNTLNQKLIGFTLARLGITYDQAYNGKEALDRVQQKKYAVIFLDYEMPVMNGFEALVHMVNMNIDSLICIQSEYKDVKTVFNDYKERIQFLDGKLRTKDQVLHCIKDYDIVSGLLVKKTVDEKNSENPSRGSFNSGGN